MDLGLKGRRAIVTGGTKGIGRRVVDLLLSEGCDVGFCARNEKFVAIALTDLKKSACRVVGGVADVADNAVFRRWMQETIATLGGLDILVANASSLVSGADETAWQKGLDVAILGTVRAVEEA